MSKKKKLKTLISRFIHQTNRIGSGSYVAPSAMLRYGTSIGENTYLAKGTVVSNSDVGNFCSIGPNALIGLGEHQLDALSTSMASGVHTASLNRARTRLEGDVWVGGGAVVRAGVTIGVGAVVGANSVVTKNVDAFSVVVGSPAKPIRFRLTEELRATLVESKWWLKSHDDAVLLLKELARKSD